MRQLIDNWPFLLGAALFIVWYIFTMAYVIPRMPYRWNGRAVWLFAVAFVPVLIPFELLFMKGKA